ncbi:MAG: hypothetical protein WA183_05725 [Chthoniobacterales bacterium]
MKRFSILFGAIAYALVILSACTELDFAPPPVPKELVQAGGHRQASLQQLETGRRFFVSRCIECHTLPVASRFAQSEWPCIVYEMGNRAALKHMEREAVLAYILAIRAQQGSR